MHNYIVFRDGALYAICLAIAAIFAARGVRLFNLAPNSHDGRIIENVGEAARYSFRQAVTQDMGSDRMLAAAADVMTAFASDEVTKPNPKLEIWGRHQFIHLLSGFGLFKKEVRVGSIRPGAVMTMVLREPQPILTQKQLDDVRAGLEGGQRNKMIARNTGVSKPQVADLRHRWTMNELLKEFRINGPELLGFLLDGGGSPSFAFTNAMNFAVFRLHPCDVARNPVLRQLHLDYVRTQPVVVIGRTTHPDGRKCFLYEYKPGSDWHRVAVFEVWVHRIGNTLKGFFESIPWSDLFEKPDVIDILGRP
jgi:hypothetical protein